MFTFDSVSNVFVYIFGAARNTDIDKNLVA